MTFCRLAGTNLKQIRKFEQKNINNPILGSCMNSQKAKVGPDYGTEDELPQGLSPGKPARLAWLPIPLLLAAIIAARAAGLSESYESDTLTLVLSFTFYTLVSLGTLFLIGRSFLALGTPGLLLLECGVVLWSLAGTVGDAVSHGDANINVTIFNTGILLAGLCHLAGAILSLRPQRALRAQAPVAGGGLRARPGRAVAGHAGGAGGLAAGLLHPGPGGHAGALLRAHFGHRHVRALRRPVARRPARGAPPVYLLVRPRPAAAGGGAVRRHDPVVPWQRRELAGPHGAVARRGLSAPGRRRCAARVTSAASSAGKEVASGALPVRHGRGDGARRGRRAPGLSAGAGDARSPS